MNEDLQKRIQDALANPQNMGELANADAIGTVGNSDCGEMLRLWVKFKQQDGKKVIERATFQSFGCETAKPWRSSRRNWPANSARCRR